MAEPAVARQPVSLDDLCINTVRTLAMDAVQAANCGHPGAPMGLAPLGYLVWTRHLRHNPAAPDWMGRDRFVLSAGHASMLLYSLLYLTGYDLPLEELKRFRQWGSRTPGHPERGVTPGVETTTGPLGQGMANAVGLAVAQAHLAARFNRSGHPVMDHRTYFVASDGDLMEGISHEAASFAGHARLGKLIGFYDDNRITIDGETALTYSDDVAQRFAAYGWHVEQVEDGNDLAALDSAIVAAKAEKGRPSLIIVRTHIGYGSPNKQDTAAAHGAPLGEEEVRLTKENLGWSASESFHVPEEALAEWRKARNRGEAMQSVWEKRYSSYRQGYPDLARELERRLRGDLPDGWTEALPTFGADRGPMATRKASGEVLNAIAARVPELIGGSADLSGSNNTVLQSEEVFSASTYGGRNFHFGVREHGMAGILNGMALHGGVIPYGGTFLIFSDYMRPSIRLAAMMRRHVVYVFTHDSIGLGEDGPTHQPVEQLSSLRTIPGLVLIRPGDAAETVVAWRTALERKNGPVALVLTRQSIPTLDREELASADGLASGGYVLTDAADGKPAAILIANGSELHLAVEARARLAEEGIRVRVVSLPSHELFAEQSAEYREQVLPAKVRPRLAIEASQPMSWRRWVGDAGDVMGIETFGASAPYQRLFEEYDFTVDEVVRRTKALLG
ncbi:MAG: transketolase [Gemmatimonadetes bacterium]|nr:transketolase [Gemmatimonadota bacterium]